MEVKIGEDTYEIVIEHIPDDLPLFGRMFIDEEGKHHYLWNIEENYYLYTVVKDDGITLEKRQLLKKKEKKEGEKGIEQEIKDKFSLYKKLMKIKDFVSRKRQIFEASYTQIRGRRRLNEVVMIYPHFAFTVYLEKEGERIVVINSIERLEKSIGQDLNDVLLQMQREEYVFMHYLNPIAIGLLILTKYFMNANELKELFNKNNFKIEPELSQQTIERFENRLSKAIEMIDEQIKTLNKKIKDINKRFKENEKLIKKYIGVAKHIRERYNLIEAKDDLETLEKQLKKLNKRINKAYTKGSERYVKRFVNEATSKVLDTMQMINGKVGEKLFKIPSREEDESDLNYAEKVLNYAKRNISQVRDKIDFKILESLTKEDKEIIEKFRKIVEGIRSNMWVLSKSLSLLEFVKSNLESHKGQKDVFVFWYALEKLNLHNQEQVRHLKGFLEDVINHIQQKVDDITFYLINETIEFTLEACLFRKPNNKMETTRKLFVKSISILGTLEEIDREMLFEIYTNPISLMATTNIPLDIRVVDNKLEYDRRILAEWKADDLVSMIDAKSVEELMFISTRQLYDKYKDIITIYNYIRR